MAYKRQQISITEEDFDLIPYYKSKPNFSKFILNCIREHKEKEEKGNQQIDEQQIIEIIKKYLYENKIEPKCNKIDNEVLGSMTKILNM